MSRGIFAGGWFYRCWNLMQLSGSEGWVSNKKFASRTQRLIFSLWVHAVTVIFLNVLGTYANLFRASQVALVVKNPAANADDGRGVGSIPWRRTQQPTPVFLPGESHGQRSLADYSPRDHKESDMAERLTTHTHWLTEYELGKKRMNF